MDFLENWFLLVYLPGNAPQKKPAKGAAKTLFDIESMFMVFERIVLETHWFWMYGLVGWFGLVFFNFLVATFNIIVFYNLMKKKIVGHNCLGGLSF